MIYNIISCLYITYHLCVFTKWLLCTLLASKRPDFSSTTLEAKLYQIRFPACPPKLENRTSFGLPLSRHSLLQDTCHPNAYITHHLLSFCLHSRRSLSLIFAGLSTYRETLGIRDIELLRNDSIYLEKSSQIVQANNKLRNCKKSVHAFI